MMNDESNPNAEPSNTADEPLIDDDTPMGNRLRFVLIAVAMGIFVGGIFLSYYQAKVMKERRQRREKNDASIIGPRYVEPPPPDAYPWVKDYDPANSIIARIPPPPEAARVQVPGDSFANWLRYLPLKPGQQKVMLHDGQPRQDQNYHCAVIDIDTGPDDLQQGPEAVLRLRAEYLFHRKKFDAIRFHVAPGQTIGWNHWRAGDRPTLKNGKVTWNFNAAAADNRYVNFRAFLGAVFALADTNSLAEDLAPVSGAKDMKIGDVFVHPGKPGHAVIVVDMVQALRGGDRAFLLAQSNIPAQDMHVLVNTFDKERLPWFTTYYGDSLTIPGWTFQAAELKRFPNK